MGSKPLKPELTGKLFEEELTGKLFKPNRLASSSITERHDMGLQPRKAIKE